jgi:hypothetical protein
MEPAEERDATGRGSHSLNAKGNLRRKVFRIALRAI